MDTDVEEQQEFDICTSGETMRIIEEFKKAIQGISSAEIADYSDNTILVNATRDEDGYSTADDKLASIIDNFNKEHDTELRITYDSDE